MAKIPFEIPDINMVEALTAELLKVNERLKMSEQARTEMLSNISHDLRAPLAAVRSALDRILHTEGLEAQEVQSILSLVDRRVTALEKLINELYYSISIEQPGFVLHKESMPIALFLEQWFIDRMYDNEVMQRRMNIEIADGLNCELLLDPHHMARTLDNLLSNAIHFTKPNDQIVLRCAREGDCVVIQLQDSGAGILPEDLPHIFERTYTASRSRSPQKQSGSGLGLHIAKTIVEMHGGAITCASNSGGSTFFITFPVNRQDT